MKPTAQIFRNRAWLPSLTGGSKEELRKEIRLGRQLELMLF